MDLAEQVIKRPDGAEIAFDVDPFRKNCLLNGLDDIGLTLQKKDKIGAFEETRSKELPLVGRRRIRRAQGHRRVISGVGATF